MNIKNINFIPEFQLSVIRLIGVSRLAIELKKLSESVEHCPVTYETEGIQVKEKLAYLHYFAGAWDWYILEKDMYKEQEQAYGVVVNSGGIEFGYINIEELKSIRGVEVDLHWTATSLSNIRKLDSYFKSLKRLEGV